MVLLLGLYCIVLYCIALYCIVLYCIVLYCIVLYCIVLYCRAHDYDKNGELDGLELLQAIMHEMEPFVVKEETIKELDLRPIDIQYRVDVVNSDRAKGILGMLFNVIN